MNSEGKFGLFETVSFVTLIIITKIFYTTLSTNVSILGTSAWYAAILSCIISIVFFLIIYALMKRFKGQNILEIFEVVLGRILGKVTGLLFCGYFLFYAASNLRVFVEMIKAYNLPYTQPSIIMVSFVVVVFILANLGLEAIARISSISFYPILIGIGIILVLAIPYYDIDYLTPIMGYGINRTFQSGIMQSSMFSEIIILAFVFRAIHGSKNFKKAGLTILTLSGIIFSVTLLCYVSAFQYTMGSENLSGLFQMSKLINIGSFFQRMESLFLFIWVISSLITVAATFYIAISIYCKVFEIDDHKPLVLMFSYLLFMFAILPKNLAETVQNNLAFVGQYSMGIVFGIPVMVFLIALIMRKKGDPIEAK